MNNLLIVINTCENYFKYNKMSLLKQINDCKLKNIIIVSGQENVNEIVHLNGIKVIKVKYTGLHHTGAIYIAEHYNEFIQFKYFMLLPDTIQIGEKFKDNIFKYYTNYLKDTNLQIFGFINPYIRPSMDMGIFNIEHIRKISEYLFKIKTFDLSKNNLINLKKILIFDENTIFGNPISNRGNNYHTIIKTEDKKFLCNDKKLIIEKQISKNINQVYLPLLDLYKFQRNFKGPCVNLILEYNV